MKNNLLTKFKKYVDNYILVDNMPTAKKRIVKRALKKRIMNNFKKEFDIYG